VIQKRTAAHIISVIEKLVKKYDSRDPYELCRLLGIKAHYHDMQKKLKVFLLSVQAEEDEANFFAAELLQEDQTVLECLSEYSFLKPPENSMYQLHC
jgi:hypothetical protein